MVQIIPLNNKGVRRTALLDGDVIKWRVALRYNLNATFCTLEQEIMKEVKKWTKGAFCHDFIICMSDDKRNFRKEVYKKYKANRKDREEPELLAEVGQILRESDHAITMPGLEGDDVMGICGTRMPEQSVVVTIDKDLATLPVWIYNPDKNEFPYKVTEADATFNLWCQVISGDNVDGYKGAHMRGPVSARNALGGEKLVDYPGLAWGVYQKTKGQGYTKEYFCQMVNCARILGKDTVDDNGEPILYTPNDMDFLDE